MKRTNYSFNFCKRMFSFGQFASTTQFYLHGRYNCTQTGWQKHAAAYPKPDFLTTPIDLTDKYYLITGANAGIGREITKFLASKGATIFMFCRNATRANEAKELIVAETGISPSNLRVIICDCSLHSEISRAFREVNSYFEEIGVSPSLHGVVCNAGAMFNSQTFTIEGIESTLALHLLIGTHFLVTTALPWLENSCGSRVVVVSSAGMYNCKFPNWLIPNSVSQTLSSSLSLLSTSSSSPEAGTSYDGQMVYAYAKRGQVLFCEHFSATNKKIKFVSCHPGWTLTEAVEAAYGEKKKYLEPLRTPWEGAEGIIYLCCCDANELEGGAFYLDRSVMPKHMAGAFFSEGSFTKNTPEEIYNMIHDMDTICISIASSSSSSHTVVESTEAVTAAVPENDTN